ncbi:MAG: zinc/iron-chelating domain-containing protein [Desulfuromonas sp.]|uniref:YkgJ family cysteine cluster protein n=1 Tax=Desulfuromonas sp. TaxID=892 RepID=UPI000CBD1C1E|nr:YkgJ family cysteine cluster protein [Desulfuromonas sp.]PLX83344.1 MAG: zinc/iron-chelating domain-containing protein [Desulfuromonas sp.]
MWQGLKDMVLRQRTHFDAVCSEKVEAYREEGGHIYCRKGCGNCCTLAVNTVFTEALLLAEALSPGQVEAVALRSCRTRELVARSPDLKTFLRLHRRDLGVCPFLDGAGSCGVYGHRPLSCRSLLATRPGDWCGVDFGDLPEIERQVFMSGLDRRAVAFPTHYLASTQELARQLEEESAALMGQRFGVAVTGNLPYLVALEREHRLSEVVLEGYEATVEFLEDRGLNLPYLIHLAGVHPDR